ERVREFLLLRNHAEQRALGECAVTDLATAGAAERLRLTRRERREVVVQHEALPAFAGERVDLLLVRRGAERRRDERLRLATLEERRAVHARQKPHLDRDRADLVHVAPVDALVLRKNVLANDVVLALLELFLDELLVLEDF